VIGNPCDDVAMLDPGADRETRRSLAELQILFLQPGAVISNRFSGGAAFKKETGTTPGSVRRGSLP
jgi:hypothetical protein